MIECRRPVARSLMSTTTPMVKPTNVAQKFMLHEFPWDDRYRLSDLDNVLTPALAIYPEIVDSNIERTLALLDGKPERWRVHIKTAKLAYTLRMLVQHGVRNFKCATTLELLTACLSGAGDVLVAYPVMGANARRTRELADQFPAVRISALAENEQQGQQWRGSQVGVFLDINPGMNRTGIEQSDSGKITAMVHTLKQSGVEFRGLHYYDGQFGGLAEPERSQATRHGYERLLEIVSEIKQAGATVPEVVTAGTPTFSGSLAFAGFRTAEFLHRVSPGTVVYGDATSLAQLPPEYGYRPAALVLSRVASRPHAGVATCDAGHKAVSADAGVPTCVVVGHPELLPLSPSEEHLPMQVEPGAAGPEVGEILFLLPRHVCPTVNNFDDALIVRNGAIEAEEKVSARGHEAPVRN